MYVRVHRIINQWFRTDTGALVGTEISSNSPQYKRISKIIGKQILIKNTKNELKTIYFGFFSNNKFTRLNPKMRCSDKSCGYYAFVLE